MGSAQRVVILAGLPGSGKTTLAHRLAACGFVWINQDAMGSRQNCERAFTEAMSAHKDIVVDRCNFDQAQRSTWLSYARAYGVQCIGVQLIIPIEVCIERALARKDHPTLGTKGSIHDVIPRFARDFRLMFENEGFSRVFTIKQQSDIGAFMRFISPPGQANRLQQRLPGLPSMQQQPLVITPALQHAAPQQWQPSGPHMSGASQHAAPQPAFHIEPCRGSFIRPASQQAAPQHWHSPDTHRTAAETWRSSEGLNWAQRHHSEAHGMDADEVANGMLGNSRLQSCDRQQWHAAPEQGHTPLPHTGANGMADSSRRPSNLRLPRYSGEEPTGLDINGQPGVPSKGPKNKGKQKGRGGKRTAMLLSAGRITYEEVDQRPGPQNGVLYQQTDGVSSNIVPFPAHGRFAIPVGNAQEAAQRFLDVPEPGAAQDLRPILLFDLNGTLTSHTAARRSAGINLMRPGIHHLTQLQDVFRLGVFSSASQRTVSTVIPMLEQAAALGRTSAKDKLLPYRHLILTRSHTVAAPKNHVKNGGKAWDTVKPLHKWFKDLSRVLLVDDDSYKAVEGEEANMIIIPRWEEESSDVVLAALTASLLEVMRNIRDIQSADMRQHSRAVMEAMPRHMNKLRAQAQQDDIEIDLTSESSVECEEMMKEAHMESRQAELVSV